MNSYLTGMYGYSLSEAQRMMENIPCERCADLAGTSKHPAWLIGHLALAADLMLMLAGGEMKYPQWTELYMPGSEPQTDRSLYPKKDEVLAILAERHAALTERVSQMTQADFEQVLPKEEYRSFFPTVGHAAVYFLASHEMYHLGQLCIWRNAAGIG